VEKQQESSDLVVQIMESLNLLSKFDQCLLYRLSRTGSAVTSSVRSLSFLRDEQAYANVRAI